MISLIKSGPYTYWPLLSRSFNCHYIGAALFLRIEFQRIKDARTSKAIEERSLMSRCLQSFRAF